MPADRAISPTARLLGEYLGCSPDVIDNAIARQHVDEGTVDHRRIGELLLDGEAVGMEQLLEAITSQRKDRLRACSLFMSLTESELESLSAVFQEISIARGEQFITQDETDPSMYVLAAGTCKVFRMDDEAQEIPLARLFPGEPVGEMGYFSDSVRSASVRAVDDVMLLRANYDDLTDCFENVPAVAGAFMEVVTKRLRNTNLLYQENRYLPGLRESSLGHLGNLLDHSQIGELEEGIDRLLVRMVHSASRLTYADRASLFLIDSETGELWTKVAEGAEVKEIRVPSGSGIVGWVVENNELLNIEEAYDDERFNQSVDRRTGYRTHTILCAPLRGLGNRVLGAVQVINKEIGVFTEDDESLLRAFAAQTAIAVENINLFRDVVRGYRRMALLLDLATIVAGARDQQTLSSIVSKRLVELFRCERAQVFLHDGDSGELWCLEGEERRYQPEELVAGGVLFRRETVNIVDAYDDDRFDPEIDAQDDERTRNLLATPLLDGNGEVQGVVQVMNRIDGVFDEDDVESIQLAAAQIGMSALLKS